MGALSRAGSVLAVAGRSLPDTAKSPSHGRGRRFKSYNAHKTDRLERFEDRPSTPTRLLRRSVVPTSRDRNRRALLPIGAKS